MSSENASPASTALNTAADGQDTRANKLHELLQKNFNSFGIIYNGYMANHMVHDLYSLHKLGGSPRRLEIAYEEISKSLEPLPKPSTQIDKSNFMQSKGHLVHFVELRTFFASEIARSGMCPVLNTYLPQLIPGLAGAALHPLIHIGFAMEYKDPNTLAEGLAYAVMGYNALGEVIDTPTKDPQPNQVQQIKDVSGTHQVSDRSALESMGLLDILNSIRLDSSFDDVDLSHGRFQQLVMRLGSKHGALLASRLNQWKVTENNLEKCVRELSDAVVVAFAGYESTPPMLNFFLAHLVTSLHAVRVIKAFLPAKQVIRLLRIHCLAVIVLYIVEGRNKISRDNLLAYKPRQSEATDTLDWKRINERALDNHDEHVCKLIVAFKDLENAYGENDAMYRLAACKTLDLVPSENAWQFYAAKQL